MTAHSCILDVMEIEEDRFKIEGLAAAIQVCYWDFLLVWSPDSPLLKTQTTDGSAL
jgi:hypothetical protein